MRKRSDLPDSIDTGALWGGGMARRRAMVVETPKPEPSPRSAQDDEAESDDVSDEELGELMGRSMMGNDDYDALMGGDVEPSPFDIDDVMGPDGPIAAATPGYQVRPGQLTLAAAIDKSFRDGTNLMVEGPTGIGKSKGALVPAILHAIHHTRRAVYCTSSIMLQEQLAKKDLPDLQRAMPGTFRWAVLKGVNNYVCRKALLASQTDADAMKDSQVFRVAEFVERNEIADLADYDVELSALTKSRVTTTSDECQGQKCSEKDRCGMLRARQRAKAAHVVVTNYHLYFADLQMRRANENVGILPKYDDVIFDEGHAVGDIARSFLGFEVSAGSLRYLAQRLMPIDPETAKRIQVEGQRFFDALTTYGRSKKYRARLHRQPYDAETLRPIDYEEFHRLLREGGRACMQAAEKVEGTDKEAEQKRTKLRALSGTCDKRAAELKSGMTLKAPVEGMEWCFYLKDEGQQRPIVLAGMPIHVAPMLRRDVFEHDTIHSVVVMSATLQASGSFEMIKTDLGCESATELEVPSPFDWPNQALVCLPPGMPLPASQDFIKACGLATIETIRAAKGRTLGLFTSRRALEEVARMVRAAKLPYNVYIQGELPRGELVRRFRDDVSSVLLGTASLWEGVDVQGESLSAVVIDKIPFESPDSPLADYWNDARRDSFMKRSVPLATIDLRQGIGRLIRTVTDRGVIVFLDPRCGPTTGGGKPYGKKIMRAFPAGTPQVFTSDWRERISMFLKAGKEPPTRDELASLFPGGR